MRCLLLGVVAVYWPAPSAAAELNDLQAAAIEAALAADQQQRLQQREPAAEAVDASTTQGGFSNAAVRVFQSLNPDISFIADFALSAFTTDTPLQLGAHDPQRTGFTFQQLEMAVSAAVDPYFRFDANIVFAEFGVEVEEAYGTTLALPAGLQARAGQFLTRFGRINATHPHSWLFMDQPLVIGKMFGAEGNRGVGIELSWLSPLPWYVEVLGSISDAAGEATARSFYGPTDLGVNDPRDFQFTTAIKQFFPLDDNWSLMWGLSAASGPNSTGQDNRSNLFGTDIYLKYRPITQGSYFILSLEAEGIVRLRQVPQERLTDFGSYTQLFSRFARRWGAAVRYEYVSGELNDYLDPEWTEARQRVSSNVTFWPTEFSRLRLQHNYDRPQWRDDFHAVMLNVEFVVGSHGAHRF